MNAAAPTTTWDWLEERFGRRQFLLKAGWGFFYLFLGGWLLSNLRYMFPNVLYEPSLSFKAGKPAEYPVGVSEKWKKAQRVWIIRTAAGFYCIWSRCTHLGCTPNWFEAENRFKCPCHGSNYNIDGDVLQLIPANVARQYCLVPVDRMGDTLTLAMADPLNTKAVEDISMLSHCSVQVFVATVSDVIDAIERHYGDRHSQS